MYRHFSSMLSLITGYCFQTVLFDIVQVSEIGQLHNAISFIFKLDRLLSSLYAQAHFCVCYCFIIFFFKSSSSFKYSKITGHIFNTLHQYTTLTSSRCGNRTLYDFYFYFSTFSSSIYLCYDENRRRTIQGLIVQLQDSPAPRKFGNEFSIQPFQSCSG